MSVCVFVRLIAIEIHTEHFETTAIHRFGVTLYAMVITFQQPKITPYGSNRPKTLKKVPLRQRVSYHFPRNSLLACIRTLLFTSSDTVLKSSTADVTWAFPYKLYRPVILFKPTSGCTL